MAKSKMSVILLVGLGVLVVLFAAGKAFIEWEWWTFLLILASLAFVVGFVLFVIQRVLR